MVLGDGRQTKPYLYVGDLIRAILLVFDHAAEPLGVYHAGPADATSVAEIARVVLEEMGLPEAAIEYTGGTRGWVGDVAQFQYDQTKIAALGFQPSLSSTGAVRLAVRRILRQS